MKKRLVSICIFILLIGILLSGCDEPPEDLEIKEVVNNYEAFVRQNISVEGMCIYNPPYGYIMGADGTQLNIEYQTPINGHYRLNGILCRRIQQNGYEWYYLNVTKVIPL